MSFLFAFIIGASIGSFLNVLIVRIPQNKSIAFPASHCPKCKNRLRWWHNIPIISWLMLKGVCAYCKNPISIAYPFIELLTGLLFITVALKTGLNIEWFIVCLIFSLLLALSLIDFKYYAVPDSLNFTALGLALFMPLFFYIWDLSIGDLKNGSFYFFDFLNRVKDGAILAAVFFALGFFVKKVIKKDALGEADIIIAATMGALLGFPLALVAIYISAILALLPALIAKNNMVPFVPFLALGTWISYIFSDKFLKWWNMLYA